MHLREAGEVGSERASSLGGMGIEGRINDCGYQGNIQQLWTFYIWNILCTSHIYGSCFWNMRDEEKWCAKERKVHNMLLGWLEGKKITDWTPMKWRKQRVA